MQFSLGFFTFLVMGAVYLAAAGAALLMILFLVDTLRRRVW